MATVLSTSPLIFAAPYAPDDEALIRHYIAETRLDVAAEARIDARATRYIEAIRGHSGVIGGLEVRINHIAGIEKLALATAEKAEAKTNAVVGRT